MRKIFNYEQGIDMKWAEVILRNKLEAHPRFIKILQKFLCPKFKTEYSLRLLSSKA